VGLLLASVNPLALDVVAGEIIGLRREQNPVLLAAAKRGLAPTRLEEVSVIGADISELKITDFKFPVTIYGGTGMGKLPLWQRALAPIFKSGMSLTPRVVAKKCVGCAICRDSCPVGAITITEEKPKHARIDEKKCIRCYCCHELCPEKAVELRKGFLYRQIMRD
jgi:ferredoxin